jgi:hypothetical protein
MVLIRDCDDEGNLGITSDPSEEKLVWDACFRHARMADSFMYWVRLEESYFVVRS